jgi:hypothetical protein
MCLVVRIGSVWFDSIQASTAVACQLEQDVQRKARRASAEATGSGRIPVLWLLAGDSRSIA